jgi:23S rRNA (adenine2503-C2)-methyltransferase
LTAPGGRSSIRRVLALPVADDRPIALAGLTRAALKELAEARLPRGAGLHRKVQRQVFEEGRFEPESLGASEVVTTAWRRAFSLELPATGVVINETDATGDTAKATLRLADGAEVEMVLLPMGRDRRTLCISSQVGCKMGCTFCETGRMGLIRHLRADEIVSQLLVARFQLGWDFRNLVFMGMGEALDNFEQVIRALHVITDASGLSMAQERITVCTVGNVEGINRLAEQRFKRLNLSVSLNAANDALRSELMPVNRRTPLAELQQALIAYRPRRNFALGVNYCLLPGLNDQREHARQIAEFCAPLERVMVNLIPFNPGTAPITRAPTEEEAERFVEWLREEGLPVRRRVTKGRSVMAACGQLGNVELRSQLRKSSAPRPAGPSRSE